MSLSVTDIANNIWINELNQSSTVTIPEIAFWVRSNGIGSLNSLIYTSYTINSDTLGIEPDTFGIDELAILGSLYMIKFFQTQSNSFLGASGVNDIIEYSSDGTTIRRLNRGEQAKTFLQLKSQAQEYLTQLISSYKINRANPRQVVGVDGSTLSDGWYDIYNRSAYRYGYGGF